MKRIHSIDFTRGLVMIIMALDHVRDLIHVSSIVESPTNLATTTPMLFFTRWITYLCAPTFVFLAGTSACLSLRQNNNNVPEVRTFLLTRGFYLLLLEFTVVNFLLFFDLGYHTLIFEVIAAIGFGFIVLSLLLRLSFKTIGVVGAAIIVLHDLFGTIRFMEGSGIKSIFEPLLSTTAFSFSNRIFVMGYPPIPWLGIMLLGFACGKLFEENVEKRRSIFIKMSGAALSGFVIIRTINVYGDSLPWSIQPNAVYTVLSFLNVSKYPPSLVFCLSMLGIMFFVLALAERPRNKIIDIVCTYGRVPLFYFLTHFFVMHVMLLIILLFQGIELSQFEFASGTFGRPRGVPSGLPLSVVYIVWILVVVLLYKPCQMYALYKSTNRHWWLKYL